MISIPVQFINEPTRQFFNDYKRNSCLSGGFGSGKTYVLCLKALILSTNFRKYRSVFARQEYKALKHTTLKTFLKICPESLIQRWSEQDGYMKFTNGSEILWMHLDSVDEQTLRGLEVNSAFLDQAEEISEYLYDILDARVGRWDKAEPSRELLRSNSDWPKDDLGNWKIPSYMLLDCNPDNETHFIYRRYHPDSPEHHRWAETHSYYEVASLDNPHLNPETLRTMLSRDPAWVKRFVYGQWGISEASIHRILPDSIIDVPAEFVENLIRKANLYRVLDHGDSSPTCCLWWASWKHQHFCFREYYQPNSLISEHRRNIAQLSEGEYYVGNYADPAIFKKTSQKYGGFWSTADEYLDSNIHAPPLFLAPADNNELSTRNRINELLALDPVQVHPVTGQKNAPAIYFIRKNIEKHNFGCENVIFESRAQKRIKLGEINGKPIFSDERDESVPDHAYDPFRYYIAMHASFPKEPQRKPSETSFMGVRNRLKALQIYQRYNRYGDRRTLA